MLTVFTVSVGYGVTLPLLPYSLQRIIGSVGTTVQISRHTGLLAAIYLLALVLFAPLWGRLSDQIGRRSVLLMGLSGFSGTMAIFSFLEGLEALYAERFFSGIFAAAVTPIASAFIGDVKVAEGGQARRLTMVSLAGMAGFLLGPMLGVFITRVTSEIWYRAELQTSLATPLRFTALLAMVAFVLFWLTTSGAERDVDDSRSPGETALLSKAVRRTLLLLAFVVSTGGGVFETDLALRGEGQLGLTPYQVAVMFTECSLVMILAQAIGFAPAIRPKMSRWVIAIALVLLAAGLALAPYASSFTMMLATVAFVASSAGVLAPILTYWISIGSGAERGIELGRQTAASSLGGALGSLLGGLLTDVGHPPHSSLMFVATGMILSAGLAFGLLNGLKSEGTPRKSEPSPASVR
ncbi:MAG: MFS transporter [Rhodospirillaceae bacterium]|nr:MAG: MFS transporter [Rhodospirillaceae bacterium]